MHKEHSSTQAKQPSNQRVKQPGESKTVLITGCSSGIGKALALACVDAGYNVIATARKIESISDLHSQHPSSLTTLQLDVTDNRSIEKVVQKAGVVDILINNAGYGAMGAMLDISNEAITHQFATNTFAPLALAQAFAPAMIKQKSGMIVNVGSVSGLLTTPFAGAYCASKAALHSLSDAMRIELAPLGIQVITVQPGGIQSEMGKSAARQATRNLPEASMYLPMADAIQARALASQEEATPAKEFADALVKKLSETPPDCVIRYGSKSGLMSALALLPKRLTDKILSKRFKLHQLSR